MVDTSTLNSVQQDAVRHFGAPLLIIAGAGSGKTRVITYKISYLIEQGLVEPYQILAVTFTNKAAREMRERAVSLCDKAVAATLTTFHSYGARFLRRYGTSLGLASSFSIYDDSDSLQLLKSIFPNDNADTLKSVAHKISMAKNYTLTPQDDLSHIEKILPLNQYYDAYQKKLSAIGNVDFGDLILLPLQALRESSDIRAAEHQRYRVLLIDEYQDTNRAQSLLVSALVHEEMYLCAVGDDDQSIYAFRGAEVQHIVGFASRYAGAHIMRLEQNYRSTGNILKLATHVVNKNINRHGKKLWTEQGDGMTPQLSYFESDVHEAKNIVDSISNDWQQIETAVAYRTNAQSRLFESELLRYRIPYQIIGSLRFYEREEVKDVISFLKFIANSRDEVAMRRIINKPARGIGVQSVRKIVEEVQRRHTNFHELFEIPPFFLSQKVQQGLSQLSHVIKHCLALLQIQQKDRQSDAPDNTPQRNQRVLSDIMSIIVEESGLLHYYRQAEEGNNSNKIQNIDELLRVGSEYPATMEGVVEFLQNVELESAIDTATDDNHVTLITLHNTKGIEFERVFIVGMQDGLFPRLDDSTPDKIEEERRLFYVGITRAKKQLYLSTFLTRFMYGKFYSGAPSLFLNDLASEQLVSVQDYTKQFYVARHGNRNAYDGALLYRSTDRHQNGYRDGYRYDNDSNEHRHSNRSSDGAYARRTSQHRVHDNRPNDYGGHHNHSIFNNVNNSSYNHNEASSNSSHSAHAGDEARFSIGDTVYHDDYGTGQVVERNTDEDDTMITVLFQTGNKSMFIEKYASLDIVEE